MKLAYFVQVLAVLLLVSGATSAQTAMGTIRGRVMVGNKGLELATVAIPGTTLGTSTDAQGRYELRAVPAGTHTVIFSSVGYQLQRQQLTTTVGQVTEATVELMAVPAALAEVVVTGVSRVTEVRKSPVPIAVLSKREVNLNSNGNLVDAAVKGVPGLSAVTTGPNISKPFIRGLGYNRVLTLYNGLRQEGQQWGDEHGIEIDQYDIDRIEVVKGPASLIYGSDAVAGVINMLPRLPNGSAGQLHGDALTEYQTNNNLLGTSVGLNYNKNGWQYAARVPTA
ncbi:TonB-dependent receptor [Hymenobacter volaticus]|uniref:TonB-dependent receptor plug domain-containing protein n=1 Tax=Hymenobacter volaticus TaxID=2932254 RepID=A0ABY4G4K0_9BACT|nr:TonB-dependent receptor plug domain-containing protein [Hymenobacter volaticus]UOQ65777.1 TonB-dependent receptor plug domain-containing protein [Hymenobacter volaticus]